MERLRTNAEIPANYRIYGQRRRLIAPALAALSGILLVCGIFLAARFFLGQARLSRDFRLFSASSAISRLKPDVTRSAGIRPVNIRIDSLKINAGIVPVGLADDATLQVPENELEAGWYMNGSAPGETGPAIITGHFDTTAGPAVFWDLKKIQPGDRVEIGRSDGSTAIYNIIGLEEYPQDNFPTDKVYNNGNGQAALRIITCAGTYDKNLKRYSNNLVAYGDLSAINNRK